MINEIDHLCNMHEWSSASDSFIEAYELADELGKLSLLRLLLVTWNYPQLKAELYDFLVSLTD